MKYTYSRISGRVAAIVITLIIFSLYPASESGAITRGGYPIKSEKYKLPQVIKENLGKATVIFPGTSDMRGQRGNRQIYDTVIMNGIVVDPETETVKAGFNIGIKNSRIAEITDENITGKETINAEGRIVSPGFIDVLSYSPNDIGNKYKIGDGVTTNLAMHGATAHFKSWFDSYSRRKMLVNYGGAVFVGAIRSEMGIGRYSTPTAGQIEKMKAITEQAIKEGGIGISFSPEYLPGTSADEIKGIMNVGKKYGMTSFFHVRYSDMIEPGTNIDAIKEVIGYARETGCPVQVVHIVSTGGTYSMPQSLKLIDDARKEGLDITIDTYPYHYWATYANSARFDDGWQQRFGIGYSELQVGGSREIVTAESFKKFRKLGILLVAYAIPKEDVALSLQPDYCMIGSDCIIEPSLNNHPRGSGCFSRTIGLYSRELKVITLMKAIKMMTLTTARRFEDVAPALKQKARLQVGKDADIVVFDYNTIIDTATVENPASYSKGIEYVMVNGVTVKDLKGIRTGVSPGKPIRSNFK